MTAARKTSARKRAQSPDDVLTVRRGDLAQIVGWLLEADKLADGGDHRMHAMYREARKALEQIAGRRT